MMPLPWRLREQRAVLIAFAVAVVVFALWPQLDLLVARWCWQPGRGFIGREQPWAEAIYRLVPLAGRVLAVALLIVALAGGWLRIGRRWRQRAGLALIAAVIGQGVFIDQGLKNHWGRPRPEMLAEFGGSLPYQAPLAPSTLCDRNCSFVSGHAAGGFGLLALGLLAPPRARRRWLFIGVGAGAVFGLVRMLQGGHFLSDIVFSFFATWLGAQLALQGWRVWVRRRWRADRVRAA